MSAASGRALVTFATGPHEELLDIAMPSFEAFAGLHGYDIVQPDIGPCERPVSWWKVPALKAVLGEYDEALWVDADIVIVDPSADLDVPAGAWQALVRHQTGDGDVPNCGVWLVRRPMLPVLDEVWAQTHRVEDGWWEQAALMDLMGFDRRAPARLVHPSPLYENTHWLDHGFNVHMWDTPGAARPRFMHASMHKDRAAVMQTWAADGAPYPLAACGHRYPLTGCLCETAVAPQKRSPNERSTA